MNRKELGLPVIVLCIVAITATSMMVCSFFTRPGYKNVTMSGEVAKLDIYDLAKITNSSNYNTDGNLFTTVPAKESKTLYVMNMGDGNSKEIVFSKGDVTIRNINSKWLLDKGKHIASDKHLVGVFRSRSNVKYVNDNGNEFTDIGYMVADMIALDDDNYLRAAGQFKILVVNLEGEYLPDADVEQLGTLVASNDYSKSY